LMTDRVLLGMLTPSSNTVLEPVCAAMLAGVASASAHFSRFRVTEISLGDSALGQFDLDPMLQAASLLADAKVDVICWNGTSGGWLGLDRDRALCKAITERTAVAATSSALALYDVFGLANVTYYGLVTPYVGNVQQHIVANFRKDGFECVAERHLDISDNFAFSEVTTETLSNMVREVATAKPQAITIFCTNLWGSLIVEELEQELRIPIYDTIATGVWASLRAAKLDPSLVRGWGRLFRDVA
jgi:maleate isomerase